MHVRCPHCRNPIELVDDAELSDIACPSCGSSFSLVVEETITHDSAGQTLGHFELIEQLWRMSSVRAVLARRKYTGTFVYGARNGGKYFCWRDGEIVPRRKSDKFVDSDPIVIDNNFEAIIDQETFERTQAKLLSRKPRTSRKKARQYLLSGLVKCGNCGGAMGGIHPSGGALYRYRLYHQTGRSACYCNTIQEAPLVSVIIRKIQERYLCQANLDRLRKALEKEQSRNKPKPRDLARIRKEIDRLSSKIDQAEDTILDAPTKLRPGLYRKLEELIEERKRLVAELDALSRHEHSVKDSQAEIDRAIDALKNLGEALNKAKPEDTKQLLASIVTKIELFYEHEETNNGRQSSTFTHGIIYVRPNASGGWETDPKSTLMIKKGPRF